MRENNYFLCTLYMKFGRYIMKNKTYVIILLVSLLILHSSGLLDNLLGLREKVLIEGAKGKKSEKEQRAEERQKNIKRMKKSLSSIDREVAKLKKQQEIMGITSEERDLVLQIIDFQIRYFENIAGFLLFRSNKPGNFSMDTGTKIFFGAYTMAFQEFKNEKRKIDHNNDVEVADVYVRMLDRMKRYREIVANMETIDGGGSSSGGGGEKKKKKKKSSGGMF